MCGSNRPCPNPLPGKTGDIIFFAAKIGDSPGVGHTRVVMSRGRDMIHVMSPVLPGRGGGEGPIFVTI